MSATRRPRGRPRKFAAPSRALNLTLPEATLQKLRALDDDVSYAIVRAVDKLQSAALTRPAELEFFGRRAIITIRPTPALERRAGVELIPLPGGRALLSFDEPQTLADLELTLQDAIEGRGLTTDERQVFEGIAAMLRDARRANDIRLLRRNIIVLEYVGTRHRSIRVERPRTRRTSGREPGSPSVPDRKSRPSSS